MTHTVTPTRYRIGRSIGWDLFTSSLYFNKSLRMHMILTVSLKYITAIMGIKAIKLFISWENRIMKFNLIGFRLTDVLYYLPAKNLSAAPKEAAAYATWKGLGVESYEAASHRILDNYIHSLSPIQPLAHRLNFPLNVMDDWTDFFEARLSYGRGKSKSKVTDYRVETVVKELALNVSLLNNVLKNKFYVNNIFNLILRNSLEGNTDGGNGLAALGGAVKSASLKKVFRNFSAETKNFILPLLQFSNEVLLWKSKKKVLTKIIFSWFKARIFDFNFLLKLKRKGQSAVANSGFNLSAFLILIKFLRLVFSLRLGFDVKSRVKKLIFFWFKKFYLFFRPPTALFMSNLNRRNNNKLSGLLKKKGKRKNEVKAKFLHAIHHLRSKKKKVGANFSSVINYELNPFRYSQFKPDLGVGDEKNNILSDEFNNAKTSRFFNRDISARYALGVLTKLIIKNLFKDFVCDSKSSVALSGFNFILNEIKVHFIKSVISKNPFYSKKFFKKKIFFKSARGGGLLNKFINFKFLLLLYGKTFYNHQMFHNWIFDRKIPAGLNKLTVPQITDKWLKDAEGFLDLQNELTNLFKFEVRLTFFSAANLFQSASAIEFLNNFSVNFKKVYKNRQASPTLRFGYFFTFFALKFRSPQLITSFLADALERRRDHYTIVGAFSKLLNHFKLNDFNLVGVRLGLYGRLNGRDRKFRYYITRGSQPAFRTLDLRVDAAEEQCVGFYGVVHIHAWFYRY